MRKNTVLFWLLYFLNLSALLLKSSWVRVYPQWWSVCLTTGLMARLSQPQPALAILEMRLFRHLPVTPAHFAHRPICRSSSLVRRPW